ncbi:MAG: zinc-ribbon domain-containing protein [Kofleriaceae bacterium]
MRCASCGTDNEADSRFCGGCGARLQASIRVEPTRKMTNDQTFGRASTPLAAVEPRSQPGIHPPPVAPPAMASPMPSAMPTEELPTVRQPAPRAAPGPALPPVAASTPLPSVPRRRWGVIAVVLIIDLGLAIAGGLMLKAGLTDEPAPPAPAASKQTTESPARTPSLADTAMAAPTGSAMPVPVPTAVAAPAAAPGPLPDPPPPEPEPGPSEQAAKPNKTSPARKRTTKRRATPSNRNASPIDPYGAPHDD